jgi:hypothetical protein
MITEIKKEYTNGEITVDGSPKQILNGKNGISIL